MLGASTGGGRGSGAAPGQAGAGGAHARGASDAAAVAAGVGGEHAAASAGAGASASGGDGDGELSAAQRATLAAGKNPAAEFQEVMDFFRFSVKPGTAFDGTVMFELARKDGDPIRISVRMDSKRRVIETYDGKPPDGKVTCEVLLSDEDFKRVYSGEAGAGEISKMCLSGRIYVRWFRFRELSRFANSFDFSTERWNAFYAARDAGTLPKGAAPIPAEPPPKAEKAAPEEEPASEKLTDGDSKDDGGGDGATAASEGSSQRRITRTPSADDIAQGILGNLREAMLGNTPSSEGSGGDPHTGGGGAFTFSLSDSATAAGAAETDNMVAAISARLGDQARPRAGTTPVPSARAVLGSPSPPRPLDTADVATTRQAAARIRYSASGGRLDEMGRSRVAEVERNIQKRVESLAMAKEMRNCASAPDLMECLRCGNISKPYRAAGLFDRAAAGSSPSPSALSSPGRWGGDDGPLSFGSSPPRSRDSQTTGAPSGPSHAGAPAGARGGGGEQARAPQLTRGSAAILNGSFVTPAQIGASGVAHDGGAAASATGGSGARGRPPAHPSGPVHRGLQHMSGLTSIITHSPPVSSHLGLPSRDIPPLSLGAAGETERSRSSGSALVPAPTPIIGTADAFDLVADTQRQVEGGGAGGSQSGASAGGAAGKVGPRAIHAADGPMELLSAATELTTATQRAARASRTRRASAESEEAARQQPPGSTTNREHAAAGTADARAPEPFVFPEGHAGAGARAAGGTSPKVGAVGVAPATALAYSGLMSRFSGSLSSLPPAAALGYSLADGLRVGASGTGATAAPLPLPSSLLEPATDDYFVSDFDDASGPTQWARRSRVSEMPVSPGFARRAERASQVKGLSKAMAGRVQARALRLVERDMTAEHRDATTPWSSLSVPGLDRRAGATGFGGSRQGDK